MLLSYAKKGEAGADGPAGPPGRMGDDVRKLLWFLTVTVGLIDPASAREGAEGPTSAQSAFIFLVFRAKEVQLDSQGLQERRETESVGAERHAHNRRPCGYYTHNQPHRNVTVCFKGPPGFNGVPGPTGPPGAPVGTCSFLIFFQSVFSWWLGWYLQGAILLTGSGRYPRASRFGGTQRRGSKFWKYRVSQNNVCTHQEKKNVHQYFNTKVIQTFRDHYKLLL